MPCYAQFLSLHLEKDIVQLEMVQRKVNNAVKGMKHLYLWGKTREAGNPLFGEGWEGERTEFYKASGW